MAFFANSAVNRANLHFGIQTFAQAAGGIFLLVYLLTAGVPLPAALLTHAAILAGRFVIRPAILPLAVRFGVKPMLMAGSVLLALQYVALAEVRGIGPALFVLGGVAALGEVFYWSCYHAYFASVGDPEHRGHQLGAREAMAAVIAVAAPLAGAGSLAAFGPHVTFWGVAAIQAAAALPLIGAPNVKIAAEAPGAWKAARQGVMLQATDGWAAVGYHYFWLLALFVSVGQNLQAYGGAMALAALVAAVAGLLLGRHIDLGFGRRATHIAYGVMAAVLVLRAAAVGNPWLAVLANAPGLIVMTLQATTMMTATYNLAKASPCPMRFHIACEGGWDLGGAAAATISAGLIAAGAPLAVPILLALPAGAAAVWLLDRYYGSSAPAPSPAAH